jgi:hypothetical protein
MAHARVAITHYCERVDDSFWAEPFNAVTNLAFLLVAVLVARSMLQKGIGVGRGWDLWLLIVLIVAISIGSFLWHTLATPWTELADILPIILFITLYLPSFLVRVTKLDPVWVFFWFALFHSLNYMVQSTLPAHLFNGSIFYLPTWLALLLMTLYGKASHQGFGRRLVFALILFTLSLSLRTLDRSFCDLWSVGTHFTWHILNGMVLYLMMTTLLPRQTSAETISHRH